MLRITLLLVLVLSAPGDPALDAGFLDWLATGARWVGDGLGASGPDTIPGIDSTLDHFVTPEQFFADKPIGRRVVVLDSDGYFMAISIAEVLAERGYTRVPVLPIMSATMKQPRRRMWWNTRQICWAFPCRLIHLSRRRSFRQWL